MAEVFLENGRMFFSYAGAGFLYALYVPALIYLFVREKETWKRILFCYAPLTVLILYFLPPVTIAFRALLDESATYYRLLWLVPFAATISYAGVKLFGKHRRVGLFTLATLVIISGRVVYRSVHISRAENLYHLPQIVTDICDYLRETEEDEQIRAAFPPEMIHQVRQYRIDIILPYGRDAVEPSMHRYNAVYEEMVVPETISMRALDRVLKEADCAYLILHENRRMDQRPDRMGWVLLTTLHGYEIYGRNR